MIVFQQRRIKVMTCNEIFSKQKQFFATGKTLDVSYRIKALKQIKKTLKKYKNDIFKVLKSDLGKSDFESYMCEVGMVYSELSYMLKHVRNFSKDRKVKTPLLHFLSKSYEKVSPYGNVLIISPWNYPFLLTFGPLIDAIAAGNTVVIKPSEYSPATSELIEKMISEIFPAEYITVVNGDYTTSVDLLNLKFDMIFFTGSSEVGKKVAVQAAQNLIPVVLELGGKSPCVVDSTANISLTAKRIVFGKFLNCGQTCVAPDYIICHEKVVSQLTEEIKKQIEKQYTKNAFSNEKYGKIINEKHFNRIVRLIDENKVVYGGKSNKENLQIEPTVMFDVHWTDKVMQEEIFGPILPILTYSDANELIRLFQQKEKPLAFYIFSNSRKFIKKMTSLCQFGGGCINDTIIHLATPEMGFGGVGNSGIGCYHGEKGFYAFSHVKSIIDKKNIIDLPFRYAPYKKLFFKILKIFLK